MDRWYVEHSGAHTNEVIARAAEIAGVANTPLETQEKPYRGRKIQVWEMPYSLVTQIQLSKRGFDLKIPRVFRQRVEGGALEEWSFHKRRKLSRKTVAAKKQLKKVCTKKDKGCTL